MLFRSNLCFLVLLKCLCAGAVDKDHKISITYDEKNGDKFRKLNSWERNPDLSTLKQKGHYNLETDYTPWTVSQYSKYDNHNFNLALGKYDITENMALKAGYDYKFIEKELNLLDDPMRKLVFGKDSRWSQYNRFENIIYNKTREDRSYGTK